MKTEPDWVCLNCAKERGARIPEGHCYTVHTGVCGICKHTTSVTEPRDFGNTRHLLTIDCKYVRREGESCTLNNNCKYPNCE